jgi:hypothetical protein
LHMIVLKRSHLPGQMKWCDLSRAELEELL